MISSEVQTGNLTYKNLWLVIEVLSFMNQQGLKVLEERYDLFLAAVKEKSLKADVTWQSVLKGIEYTSEALEVTAYLNEQDVTNEFKSEVMVCL